jgi:serine/threonine-protein kinase RsbW
MSLSPTWRLERRLAPSLEEVERVCVDVRNRLKGSVLGADLFAVELVLREALVNAVTHGCRERPDARVRCEVRRLGAAIRVAVGDTGPGFDWRLRQQAEVPDDATSGRGVRLYGLYADRVAFNESGNHVVLHRRLRQTLEE